MLTVIISLLIGYIVITWYLRRLRIKDYRNRYVFITGCDTGFGNGLAKRLDQLGFHTFAACLTEKGASELTKVTSARFLALLCDVTDDSSINRALETVKSHLPRDTGLWAVVNNAGITGAVAPTEWLTTHEWQAVMSVNVLGMASVTTHFLPLLRMTRGRIINTASVLGRVAAGPAAYTVTKYCVEGYSDVLRREMRLQGVSVHIIEPGAFQTNITNSELLSSSMDKQYRKLEPEVQQYYGREYCKGIKSLIDILSKWSADSNLDKVVNAYTHAITATFPKTRYVVGVDANTLYRFLWNSPDWVTDLVFRLAYRKPDGQK